MLMKVAFASDDRATVNQHFGAARGFAIYAFDGGEQARLVELVEFAAESMDGNETKLPARIDALAGCAAVYCLAIGASAVRQLLLAGVQPQRLETATAIEPLLKGIAEALRLGGVAWIDKHIRQSRDDGRFSRMAEENWEE